MKQILTLVLVASTWVLHAQQTAFIFQVGETSVNVADGSNGIMVSFALFPDTLNFEENDIDSLDVEFVDFPFVSYNDIDKLNPLTPKK